MGKKWTNETKILFEKKKELGITRLTIAHCKQYPINPYQLVYDGNHVGFFPSWEEAFSVIDDVHSCGIISVRNRYKRIQKEIISEGDKIKCYRCGEFKEESSFKWMHKYCEECGSKMKKDYYYINKYEISKNRYSSFKNYFSTLMNKKNRKSFFSIDDLMNLLEEQNYKCAITKQDFVLEKNNPKLPSIDRINPEFNGGDYSIDNIQIVWNGLNAFKNKWDMQFLKECAKYLI